MAEPASLFDDAIKLAKMARGEAVQPFARRNNGKFAFHQMGQREGTLAAVHDIYNGMFGLYKDPQAATKTRPEEYNEQPGRMAINILKLFVDLLSVSYNDAPSRVYYRSGERVNADDPMVDALTEIHKNADYNQLLKMLDIYMRLFGNTVVRPVWDEDNRELVYHVHPGYCVRIVPNVKNPRRPWATILMGELPEMGNDGAQDKVHTAEVWLPDEFIFMKGSSIEARESLSDPEFRYDFSPLVHCFDKPPFGGKGEYWVESPGWSLAQQNVRLNEDYFSQYGYAVLMQAIGVLVVKGNIEGELTIGPGRAVHFPDPDDMSGLSSLDQGAALTEFQESIQFFIDTLRESYGIPAQMLNADVDSSGAAIIQANAPIAELRDARQPIFDRIETELLRATLQELRGRAEGFDVGIDPMEWDVAVVYPDQHVAQSVQDAIAKDQHLISLGVLTPGEIAMREKPGQFDTPEEAEAWVAENQKQQAEKEMEDFKARAAVLGPDLDNSDDEGEDD
jgi:hypothetical protein